MRGGSRIEVKVVFLFRFFILRWVSRRRRVCSIFVSYLLVCILVTRTLVWRFFEFLSFLIIF